MIQAVPALPHQLTPTPIHADKVVVVVVVAPLGGGHHHLSSQWIGPVVETFTWRNNNTRQSQRLSHSESVSAQVSKTEIGWYIPF